MFKEFNPFFSPKTLNPLLEDDIKQNYLNQKDRIEAELESLQSTKERLPLDLYDKYIKDFEDNERLLQNRLDQVNDLIRVYNRLSIERAADRERQEAGDDDDD